MNKDTLLVVMSDLHSGSIHALTVGRVWQGRQTAQVYPTSYQQKIRAQFEAFMAEVKAARKGRKVKLVFNGDCLEGDHHHSGDVFTVDMLEMANIAVELIEEFKRGIDWQRGDEVYITRGTDVHVKNFEEYIGREVNAVPDGMYYAWDLLTLDVNGVLAWFVHHGPKAGMGANEGNSLRAWLKNIYYDCLKNGERHPDIVFTGHVHQPYWTCQETRSSMTFGLMHGVITPSWQQKTRYAHMAAPVAKNRIGGVYMLITKDGLIDRPVFSVMDTGR